MRTNLTLMLAVASLLSGAGAETIHVPAKANPWLAGMTNGSAARRGDSAPDESPIPVTATSIRGGAVYTFSASGSANHGATLPFSSPKGEDLISHYLGAENGIADITAPFVSLVGVFLGPDSPEHELAPQPLDFRAPVDQDYLVLAPKLRQPFFIGDGSTSSGAVQHVVAPVGATRLFLGIMDQYQWSDNEGTFTVQVTRAASAPPVRLPLHPASKPTAADAVGCPVRSASAVPEEEATTGPQLQLFTAVELVWPTEPNHSYQVQWSPSLDQPQWANFGPLVPGSGNDASVFDSTRVHPQGFYRVQVLP